MAWTVPGFEANTLGILSTGSACAQRMAHTQGSFGTYSSCIRTSMYTEGEILFFRRLKRHWTIRKSDAKRCLPFHLPWERANDRFILLTRATLPVHYFRRLSAVPKVGERRFVHVQVRALSAAVLPNVIGSSQRSKRRPMCSRMHGGRRRRQVPNIHIAPLRYILSPSMRSVLLSPATHAILIQQSFQISTEGGKVHQKVLIPNAIPRESP